MKPLPACLLVCLAACNPTTSPGAPREAGSLPSASSPAASTGANAASASSTPPTAAPTSEVATTQQQEALPPLDPSSPIGRLVDRLAKQPLWNNGGFPKITLPDDTSTADLVAEVYRRISFDPGPVREHRIVEEQRVRIGSDPVVYTAVLTETDRGRKIVLLHHQGGRVGWWSRVMDVP